MSFSYGSTDAKKNDNSIDPFDYIDINSFTIPMNTLVNSNDDEGGGIKENDDSNLKMKTNLTEDEIDNTVQILDKNLIEYALSLSLKDSLKLQQTKDLNELPIPIEDTIPDLGRVGKFGGFAGDKYCDYKIGELFDVYCVAVGKRRICAMDLTFKGWGFIQKQLELGYYDQEMFYNVLQYCNKQDIHHICWFNEDSSNNYLKCIFYNSLNKESYENAVKLMLILHTKEYDLTEIEWHIAIGYYLGYTIGRIRGYLVRNIEILDIDTIAGIIQKILKLPIDVEKAFNDHPIVVCKEIEML